MLENDGKEVKRNATVYLLAMMFVFLAGFIKGLWPYLVN